MKCLLFALTLIFAIPSLGSSQVQTVSLFTHGWAATDDGATPEKVSDLAAWDFGSIDFLGTVQSGASAGMLRLLFSPYVPGQYVDGRHGFETKAGGFSHFEFGFNPDGESVDSAFNDGKRLPILVGPYSESPHESTSENLNSMVCAEQASDGRWLSVWRAHGDEDSLIVVRVSSDGTLDPQFGNHGYTKIDDVFAENCAFSMDGIIIETARGWPQRVLSLIKLRKNDGKLDVKWGSQGSLPVSAGLRGLYSVGERVFEIRSVDSLTITALRSEDGNVDLAFGENGVLSLNKVLFTMPLKSYNMESVKTRVLSDASYLLSINGFVGHSQNGVLLKIKLSGKLDGTFGANGVMNVSNGLIQDIVVRPSGKLIMGTWNYILGCSLFEVPDTGDLDVASQAPYFRIQPNPSDACMPAGLAISQPNGHLLYVLMKEHRPYSDQTPIYSVNLSIYDVQ